MNGEPQLVPTLISPLGFLRDRGYTIERQPDELEWWSLAPPTDSQRKARHRCTLATIIKIAVAEGWEQKLTLLLQSDATQRSMRFSEADDPVDGK